MHDHLSSRNWSYVVCTLVSRFQTDDGRAELRSCERTALRGGDPGSVGVGELEGHDAAIPALGFGLRDALAERRGVHEAVRGVGDGAGLADHELVEVDAVVGDFEERGAREGRARGVEEACTVSVEALGVELDVVLRGK